MISANDDLAAILDDCGASAPTSKGVGLLGRFVEEPVQVQMPSGHTVDITEPVFYAQASEIARLGLSKRDSITVETGTYYIKKIPPPDTTGLVRIELQT